MSTARDLLTLVELAQRCGCQVRVVERFFQLGVIEHVELRDEEPRFAPTAVDRLQRALRIRSELRVGASGLGLVLDLLDQVERLREELERRG